MVGSVGLRRGAPLLSSAVGVVALGMLLFVTSAYASATVPKAPTGVAATPRNGAAVVKWIAPINDGGSPITGYTVTSSPGSKICTTTGAKICTIHGLRNGTSYEILVKARNGVGLGAASAHVTVDPGVPLAPKNVRATAGNARARVSWIAPANNGSTIRRYTVTSIFGSKICTSDITRCTVTGLTNGIRYRFRVIATNAEGTGAASAPSAAVIPHLAPTLTITASNGTQNYGGRIPSITPTYSGFVNGDSPADLKSLPTCVAGTTSSSPVGMYASSCSGAVDPSYSIVYVDGTTTVNLVTLTMTASNGIQIFGGALPIITPTYSGFVNGDSAANLTTLPTCVSGTTSLSPVLDTYASSCSGAVDPNYTIVYVDSTTTVNPATLTITASGGIQIYGGALPIITPTYSGFVNGDSPADLAALPTCVSGTTGSSPVRGTYSSSCSGAADPNYSIVYVDGTTTVNPAALTVIASGGTQIYGGALPIIAPTYSGFVNGDSPADLAAPPTCVSGTTSSSPVAGSYSTSCTGGADPNYTIAYVDGATTVNPATLIITASSGIQIYGGALPIITPTYSGFVNRDSPANLATLPTCVSGTTGLSPVLGTYSSSCSGAADPNYSIVYVDGTTTVNPATLTITANPESKLLGLVDPVLTFVATGLIGSDTTIGSLTRVPGEALGRYAIELGTVTAGPNYTIVFVSNFLTIEL